MVWKNSRLNGTQQKSVSKTLLNTYTNSHSNTAERKSLSKTKYIAYNIKGRLLACKRQPFGLQNMAF